MAERMPNASARKPPCHGVLPIPGNRYYLVSADLFGDWREEVIFSTRNGNELRIYTTTIPTKERFYTLMHDPQYRLSIAWQNVAYNQPPHTSFYLGEEMGAPPKPNIKLVGGEN